MKTRYKYIHFDLIAQKPKTQVWGCFNNNSGAKLGEVKWYSRWRQYCYFSDSCTVFNAGCHEDIADFLKQLTRKWRTK